MGLWWGCLCCVGGSDLRKEGNNGGGIWVYENGVQSTAAIPKQIAVMYRQVCS